MVDSAAVRGAVSAGSISDPRLVSLVESRSRVSSWMSFSVSVPGPGILLGSDRQRGGEDQRDAHAPRVIWAGVEFTDDSSASSPEPGMVEVLYSGCSVGEFLDATGR